MISSNPRVRVVLPGRRREDQLESAALVHDTAAVEFGRAKTAQEVLELLDGLDRRRRIVDRRRQRPYCDIDEKSDRILWVLLEGSFALKPDSSSECFFR